jgi:uncharacterized protein YciI
MRKTEERPMAGAPRAGVWQARPVKYVLFYESAEDTGSRARDIFPSHRARWKGYAERGDLLMIGTFSDLSGAMAIFGSREAAEEFARGDPFVTEGVVRRWEIREWNEALT